MAINFKDIQGPKDSKAENFEELIALLLFRTTKNAKQVEGKGGDEGVDIYVGNDFDAEIDVYQCKYFPETLGSSQKRQIKHSLVTAVTKKRVKCYTLCIPKSLTPAEIRWLQSLSKLHSSIQIWDSTKIISKLLENPDIRREYFPLEKGDIKNYLVSLDEPKFISAKNSIAPKRFYPKAYASFSTNRLLTISGPPHMGKTALARKMAAQLISEKPELKLAEVDYSGFETLRRMRNESNLIVLIHDPFVSSEIESNIWPVLETAISRNFVIITCRNTDLVEFQNHGKIADTPFSNFTSIIESGAYDQAEMDEILKLHLLDARTHVKAPLYRYVSSEPFLRLAKPKLETPHAISYFFGSTLKHANPKNAEEVDHLIGNFNSIETAVVSLFNNSSESQRIYLILITFLKGQYDHSNLQEIHFRVVSEASDRLEMSADSFEECYRTFVDIIGPKMVHQDRYRGFEDEGLDFLHPSYREAISNYALKSPIIQNVLFAGAENLIQNSELKDYDEVCAGFKLINDNIKTFKHRLTKDFGHWVPYSGNFGDWIQLEYYFLLSELAPSNPKRVLIECKNLFNSPIVERSRHGIVRTAFDVAVLKPKKALKLLAKFGELESKGDAYEDHAVGFSLVLDKHREHAIECARVALKYDETKVKKLVASALRFVDDATFEKIGLEYLEGILDEPWEIKKEFLHLWLNPTQTEDRKQLPPRFSVMYEAWNESKDPKKIGYLVALMGFFRVTNDLDESTWLPILTKFLENDVDVDSQQSLMNLVDSYLFTVQSNSVRNDLLQRTKSWSQTFGRDPEIHKKWLPKLGIDPIPRS